MPALRLAAAVAALEAYLERHPEAADSVQGIEQWWLLSMGVDVSENVVKLALEELEQRAFVRRTTLPDGQVIWRLAR